MRNETTAHAAHHPALAHHFDNLAQQQEAASLGMWVFLLTEILFFGGLFLVYTIYRVWYPEAFTAASHHLDIPLGTVNTAVLIGSSLTMALAVHAAQLNSRKGIIVFIALTMVLGSVFLGIKGVEYLAQVSRAPDPRPPLRIRAPVRETGADFLFALLHDDRAGNT